VRGETGGACLVTLGRTQTLITTHLGRRLRRHGLSPAAFNLLLQLNRARGPLPPHEIGEALMVTRGAVTGLLDSLEARGLVRRRPHPEDRRMQLVELTGAGAELLERVKREHAAGQRQLLGCFDEREQETLTRLLAKLQAHVNALKSS
jgi:DNA-binding MarR family transcriptional regulator